MILRPAAYGDVDELVPLWLAFIASGQYPILAGATEASIRQILRNLFTVGEESCLRVVEDRSGHVVGGLAFAEERLPMTGARYADDVCWGVDPLFRSTLAGPQLFAAMEAWALARGLHFVKVGAPHRPSDPAAGSFKRFYEGRGYHAIETTYVKELR